MQKPIEHSLEDHGIENASYWQGAGVSFTNWEACFTGVGSTPKEAAEDALEQAACSGWDVDEIKVDLKEFPDESDIPEHTEDCEHRDCATGGGSGDHDIVGNTSCEYDSCMEDSELYHYAVLYVR